MEDCVCEATCCCEVSSFRASRFIPSEREDGAEVSVPALISGEEAERVFRVRDAAPALLEALQWLVETSEDPDSAHQGRALDNARAAIQSATGKA